MLFISFVPLLSVEEEVANLKVAGNPVRLFPIAYLCFVVFNVGATWWVWNASPAGSIAAFLCNAAFMAVIFTLFHTTKKYIGRKEGYIALVIFTLAWDYIHHRWDLTWPWLTLGNGLAGNTSWIQWYEFTGVPGGTAWILSVNILTYHFLKNGVEKAWNNTTTLKFLTASALVFIIPLATSLYIYYSFETKGDPVEVTAIQPNIDPYNEKFNGLSSQEQVMRMTKLASSVSSSETDFIIAPETAIPEAIREDLFDGYNEHLILHNLLKEYPQASLLIGASSIEVLGTTKPASPTARKSQSGLYYDYCNTAVYMELKEKLKFYHKSKLVPGVERMPFPQLFLPLQDFIFDLGGTTGSLGTQPNREVFFNKDSIGIAPVVCYESIFGEYVGEYISQGAGLIFIITNDGWWGNTPGYRQHLAYAQLRAIEHRRSIARSANTGTSCFITQRGDIEQPTPWWEPAAINGTLHVRTDLTFYTKYGDYMARTSLAFSGLLLLLTLLRKRTRKKVT